MPGRDGTGPVGQGRLTGRGLGPCGCGFRRGFGRGFGYKGYTSVELTKEEKQKILKAELVEVDTEKKAIEKELKEL